MSDGSDHKPAPRRTADIAVIPDGNALTALQVRHQVNRIQEIMREVMVENQHYGKVPGCGDKPALLKSGAEKLGLAFRLIPTFKVERIDLDNGHREYSITCLLTFPTGEAAGEGVGCCSTMEKKYRWRDSGRKCPNCGKEAIIKGKADYGGGWLCFAKKGGCNAKWRDGAKEIEGQSVGRTENEDIADCYNTVLKMAKKRAHVDAVLTATAASDIFTQDIDERAEEVAHAAEPPRDPDLPEGKPPRVATLTAEQLELNEMNVADFLSMLDNLKHSNDPDDLNELVGHYDAIANHKDHAVRLAAPRMWGGIVKVAKTKGWLQDRQARKFVAPATAETA